MHPTTYINVNIELCVGCGQCLLVCDVEAIHMNWGEAKIDEGVYVICEACRFPSVYM